MATVSGNKNVQPMRIKRDAIARRASKRGFNVKDTPKTKDVIPRRQGVDPTGGIKDAISRRRNGEGRAANVPGNMSPNPPEVDLGSRIRLLAGARNKSSIR